MSRKKIFISYPVLLALLITSCGCARLIIPHSKTYKTMILEEPLERKVCPLSYPSTNRSTVQPQAGRQVYP